MNKRNTAATVALAAISALVLLTGCAGSESPAAADPAENAAALGGEENAAAFDALYQQALDAGQAEVVIYGPSDHESFAEGFEARFPGITVVSEALQGGERDTRLDAEAASGNHIADIISDGTTPIVRSANDGRCTPIDPITEVPEEHLSLDDQVLTTRLSVFGLTYNTDSVAEEDVPKTLDDLLDPRWKGDISVVSPSNGGAGAYGLAVMLTPDENKDQYGMDYLEALKAQDLNFVAKDPLAVQAVANGETSLAILVFRPFYVEAAAEASNLGYSLFEQDNMWTASAQCLSAHSPNNYAAELYMNWRVSPEGQEVTAASGSYPIMPGSPSVEGIPSAEEPGLLIPQLPIEERIEGYAEPIETVMDLFS